MAETFQEQVARRRAEAAQAEAEAAARANAQANSPNVPGAPVQAAPPVSFRASVDAQRQEAELARLKGGAADTALGAVTGIERGIAGIPGVAGDVIEGLRGGYKWLHGDKANPEVMESPNPFPTGEDVRNWPGVRDIPGMHYQPTTKAGEVAQSIGEVTGGALVPGAWMKAGTAAERVTLLTKQLITEGVAPGAAAEIAGETVKQFMPQLETPARIIAGAGTSAAHGRLRKEGDVDVPGVGRVDPRGVDLAQQEVVNTGGPTRARAELENLGEGGTLWDIGPSTSGLGEGLYTSPGPQKQIIKDFMLQRRASLPGKVDEALDTHLGAKPHNFADETDAAKKARADVAKTKFDEARTLASGKTIDTSPVTQYIESRMPTSVAANATDLLPEERELLQLRGVLTNRTDFDSLKILKERLDTRIGKMITAGDNPGELIEVKKRLVDVLDQSTLRPDNTSAYKEARKLYRTDSEILEARELGTKLLEKKVNPAEFKQEWRDMSPDQQAAVKEGVRENYVRILGGDDHELVTSALSRAKQNAAREKLGVILGDKEAGALLDRMDAISRQKGTMQRAEGNSATAARQAAQKAVLDPTEAVADLPPATSYPTLSQAAIKSLDWLRRQVTGRIQSGRRESANVGATKVLTHEVPTKAVDREVFLRRLEEVYNRQRPPVGKPAAWAGFRAGNAGDEQ